jgi:hypothetical protein
VPPRSWRQIWRWSGTMQIKLGLFELVATVSVVSQADAATYRYAKRGHVQQHRAYAPSAARVRDDDGSATGYYEHRLEAVPLVQIAGGGYSTSRAAGANVVDRQRSRDARWARSGSRRTS